MKTQTKPKPFCKITVTRSGLSLRADVETFAALYGMVLLAHGAQRVCSLREVDTRRALLVTAFVAFRSRCERAASKPIKPI